MKSLVQLLSHLRSLDVQLSLEGDGLRVSAPQGVLTAELRGELAARKADIMNFLRASHVAGHNGEQGIPRIDRSAALPLSYTQQRLWFLNQLDPESPVYNISVAVRLKGNLNIAAMERALKQILHRHQALRTSFIQVDGVPQAVIGTAEHWRLQVIDAHHPDGQGIGSEMSDLIARQSRVPFDITRAPLFRASLLVAGPGEFILVLTFHHLVFDGWSFGVFVSEFAELYRAYATGREPALAPLAIQYVDFAAWQRKWLESGELDRQLLYWQKHLAGAPPVVEFPPDLRRPQVETFRGRRSTLVIPREMVAALERLSQQHGVTLFMTLLAAFNILLGRYTGQDDIVVGSPSAGRSRPELYPLIGFFVNNLVLRTDISGNPSFVELLGRVLEVTRASYQHQDVPFDQLVHALHLERSVDRSPLFQVMFAMQNFRVDELELPGVTCTPVEVEVETARFDLTVEVSPRFGELWAFFDYKLDVYKPETIARIQQHYLAILQAVLKDPLQKIGSIALLSEAERYQLLDEWNRTDADFSHLGFHQQFESHVRSTPDRVAVIAGEKSVTYAELDAQASYIAAHLKSRGAGPEKLVALCVGRSIHLVAGMLGIAKSGAAYIPLDPAYPRTRIAHIFEDANPLIVVTTAHLRPLLPADGLSVLCIDEMRDNPPTPDIAAGSVPAPENLAYVIFTSGSTGRPKGVQITHRSLSNFLDAMRKQPGLCADDVLLAVTTPSFDIAALELLLPLTTGATLCISTQPADPATLLMELDRYRPTVMQATPATWKLLLAAGWRGNRKTKILCGGEALDPDLAQSLLNCSASLWNMYGPTETTIWSAVLHINQAEASAVPVGRPIQNTSFYVLDQHLQPVPLGVAGELWIGGDGVARGYLNRPDLTRERFISSPFSSNAAERLYRTGDLVRYRSDGTLDFLGRIDHQVKFRGFRIELGEIESALRSCSGVTGAVALLRQDTGEKQLVGYLTYEGSDAPSRFSLRQQLRVTLPEYMVPAAFVFLQEFPRLPNGKLDRSSLPAPERSVERDLGSTSASSSLELAIAAAFQRALHLEHVGLDDNFFEIGAHSLQIVRIHDELSRAIQHKIPLISFFQHPTVRSLARVIEQSQDNSQFLDNLKQRGGVRSVQDGDLLIDAPPDAPHADEEGIGRIELRGVLPLSYTQQRLWFLNQLDPESPVYNISVAVRLTGNLNTAAMERALHQIVQRHEALRTSFIQEDGVARAVIESAEDWALKVIDARPGGALGPEMAELIAEQFRAAFDITRAPLFRASLLVAGPGSFILVLSFHHLVFDGWSFGVFVGEFAELYRAYSTGREASLAPLAIQYVDFAAWQRKWLESGELERQLLYWRKQLAGAPPMVEFPADFPRPQVETFRGRRSKLVIPREMVVGLERLSQQHGVTLFMTLLAAFNILLSRYTGQEDIVVGSPSAGRSRPELHPLIGFFVNNLVLRTDLSGNPTFVELLGRVLEVTLASYQHQDVPFDQLVHALHLERSVDRSPLFQVMFAMQNFRVDELELPGVVCTPVEVELETARFDLTVEVSPRFGELWAFFDYKLDVYKPETIARIQQHYLTILRAVLADPQQKIGSIALLSEAERRQLLEQWNQTEADLHPTRSRISSGADSLPARERSAERELGPAAALSGLERAIAAAFQRALHLEQVELDENFFEIGAHSLQIVRIHDELSRSIRHKIPLISFFQHPTIRSLARVIEQSQDNAQFLEVISQRGVVLSVQNGDLLIDAPPDALHAELRAEIARRKPELTQILQRASTLSVSGPLVPADRREKIPQTRAQQGMWLVQHFSPDSTAYHIPDAIVVDESIDIAVFQGAVDSLLKRHESLRTYFYEDEGELLQAVSADAKAPVGFTDLSAVEEHRREAVLGDLLREQVRQPFDLSRAPLVRFHIFRLAPQRHVIFLNIHHIISDRRSLTILKQDLLALYRAASQSRAAELPELPVQYADYAIWIDRYLAAGAMEDQIQYWKQKLAGTPPYMELPMDRPYPRERTEAGGVVFVSIPPSVGYGLNQISRREGATMFMTLLAAFAVLLYRLSGMEDFCVGSPYTHRNQMETEHLIGLFVNVLVFRCRLAGELSFREVLQRIRTTALEAYGHSDLPFQELVRALKPDLRLLRSPLFQILFGFDAEAGSAQNSLIPLDACPVTAKYDLTLQLHETSEGISGWFEYSTDLFDEAAIERMAIQYIALLQELVREPDQPVSAIDLLSGAPLETP